MNETNASIRAHFTRARRERNLHAMWFYGTWLFNRYFGTAIVINIIAISATIALILAWKGDVR